MTECIIAVDLGGTRVRAARLNHALEIELRQEMLTEDERGLDATLTRIQDMIRAVWPTDGTPVAGIGVSAPGPLNPMTGVVVMPPNLKGWHNVPLGTILRDAFDVPVYIGNDANVAGLAETVMGAARGCRHVVFITVSTGIGSGMIIDGKMLLGKVGLAAEAGHMVMVVDDQVTSWEKEASGPALARKARARVESGEESMIPDLVHGQLDDITGATVGRAAQQGDALALDIVREGGRIVGLGLVSLLHLFNPEIVVIGGGVSNLGELLFAPMREAIRANCMDNSYWQDLRIERAALGENVSIIGAACLVLTQGGMSDVSKVMARLNAG
ncbi:MAG: ROK family protein [Anaerolineae bacterium]|nr:ROK family protein [Anaerolineae bacterium]